MSELTVKCIEVKSLWPDNDGCYLWQEYGVYDISCLNLWKDAKYRLRYEDNTISEERTF